jgi:oxygen-independent coproporphyrinogen-3 oxidase
VNPESCDHGRLRAWRDAGVNRVSVGAQSLDPGVLAKLGRRHSPEGAERAIRAAADVIGNASVDLIYGARRSTAEIARADASRAVGAGAVHVSAYQLTLDPEVLAEEVPLARMRRQGRLPLPDDDDAARQGAAIRAALRRLGLRRYEISNFARPGRESVHNRLYWDGESYLGLGAGAYGCLRSEAGAVRYGNVRDARAFADAALAARLPTAEEDRVEPGAARNERLMLALRTTRGAELAALSPAQAREAGEAVRRRLAVRRAGRLVLTSRGMDLHSALSERLFE